MGHTFSNNVLISLFSSEALGPFLALFFMTLSSYLISLVLSY